MNAIDIFTALPIAILYPYFVGKLSDVVFNLSALEAKEEQSRKIKKYLPADPKDPNGFEISQWEYESDDDHHFYRISSIGPGEKMVFVKNNPEYFVFKSSVKEERRMYNNKKFIMLLIVGVVGSIISTMFYNKYKGVSIGTNIGSIVNICYATYVNWGNINEVGKLGLSGGALALLLYSGIRYAGARNRI